MRYLSLLAVLLMAGVAYALPAGPTVLDGTYSHATPENSTSVDSSTYGTKHLVKRGHVICQTGKNSPLIEHINVGIDQLDYEAGFCKQRNNEDKCKMVMKGGDAEMFICGPFSEMLPCKEIWRGIKEVRNHCKKNGRAAEEWDSLARASMQGLGRASIYLLVII